MREFGSDPPNSLHEGPLLFETTAVEINPDVNVSCFLHVFTQGQFY